MAKAHHGTYTVRFEGEPPTAAFALWIDLTREQVAVLQPLGGEDVSIREYLRHIAIDAIEARFPQLGKMAERPSSAAAAASVSDELQKTHGQCIDNTFICIIDWFQSPFASGIDPDAQRMDQCDHPSRKKGKEDYHRFIRNYEGTWRWDMFNRKSL